MNKVKLKVKSQFVTNKDMLWESGLVNPYDRGASPARRVGTFSVSFDVYCPVLLETSHPSTSVMCPLSFCPIQRKSPSLRECIRRGGRGAPRKSNVHTLVHEVSGRKGIVTEVFFIRIYSEINTRKRVS